MIRWHGAVRGAGRDLRIGPSSSGEGMMELNAESFQKGFVTWWWDAGKVTDAQQEIKGGSPGGLGTVHPVHQRDSKQQGSDWRIVALDEFQQLGSPGACSHTQTVAIHLWAAGARIQSDTEDVSCNFGDGPIGIG